MWLLCGHKMAYDCTDNFIIKVRVLFIFNAYCRDYSRKETFII